MKMPKNNPMPNEANKYKKGLCTISIIISTGVIGITKASASLIPNNWTKMKQKNAQIIPMPKHFKNRLHLNHI